MVTDAYHHSTRDLKEPKRLLVSIRTTFCNWRNCWRTTLNLLRNNMKNIKQNYKLSKLSTCAANLRMMRSKQIKTAKRSPSWGLNFLPWRMLVCSRLCQYHAQFRRTSIWPRWSRPIQTFFSGNLMISPSTCRKFWRNTNKNSFRKLDV